MIATPREWRVRTPAAVHAQASPKRWWLDLGIVVPVLAGLAYVAVLVIRLTSTLSSFYWYSDFPEALRLGDAVFHHGYGQGLAVPAQTGIGPLWVVGMLDQVTGNDIVGMTVGALMVVLAVGVMAWTAYRVIGRLGAVVVGVVCVAAPPVVAWEMLTPVAHESTVLLAGVAAWQLVSLSQPARGRAIASSALVGAVAGVSVISDALAIPAAVAPWIICAIVLVRRDHSRLLPIAITAITGVASAASVVLLSSASGIAARGGVGLAPSMDGVTAGLHSVATTLGQMISGAWYTATVPALALVGFLFFTAVIFMATRAARRHVSDLGPRAGRVCVVLAVGLCCADRRLLPFRSRPSTQSGRLPRALRRRAVVRDRSADAARVPMDWTRSAYSRRCMRRVTRGGEHRRRRHCPVISAQRPRLCGHSSTYIDARVGWDHARLRRILGVVCGGVAH